VLVGFTDGWEVGWLLGRNDGVWVGICDGFGIGLAVIWYPIKYQHNNNNIHNFILNFIWIFYIII
jgi:hypothetical protein